MQPTRIFILLLIALSATGAQAADAPGSQPTTSATTQAAAPITLTPAAAAQIKRIMKEQQLDPARTRLQVGVKGGGSTGFQYTLDLNDDKPADDDVLCESEAVRVRVDRQSHLYLEGTTIDYAERNGQKGFLFKNPNATDPADEKK